MMMLRCIEIPLISPSKSFWITFQVVVQTKMNYVVQRARRRIMTLQFMIFFVDDLIHFVQAFLSPTSACCCHCQINIGPQRLWQSSRFSVLSPHQSRRRYVLDEIYDYIIRKHWYPLSPFDKIQRMFTFPSGGLRIVFIFNYSKKIGIKWRGLSLPRSRELSLEW